ncbi:glycerol-3-phosphate cytidylyltransferase [Vagococcus lutrae]|uniref:glycerol-3-phosphate cytidylyltransferase n=1 Tax=Vagococcus lutrae TaxID=81947 RepID=UPI000F85C10D|nr:glycerol-3-phosphate cytidylyltransferase [Vagococcus lutrae]MDT2811560.1 glycerol-3-phosphate cytidylyltransferase [Vagococcus lutrae]MDT2819697.1 glycerol-3-phosphate cytidylyltransferase [Vagococcus lutrae]MDT2844509.1 glycerol-3-phosphate cytidylyltransferase [Vagococcus lutrae]RST93850.1 glycerol-3-phosphate cytidylyltransferase [Vagococcus lutrae]UQF24058.1 glycerol-3-phosphate cytidylyltransferase [Vagococcus lutrae]
MKKRVITYGTYDILHPGHINLLKRAKALGDELIVMVSTDEFNQKEKKKDNYYKFEERKFVLEALKYVDAVYPEESWEQKEDDIEKYDIDIFVMGDNWEGKFDYLSDRCEVKYLPRTEGISTTGIKRALKKRARES